MYISIHPGGIPAIGPTTVLPLPALLARSLTDDMISEAEAASQQAQNDENMSHTHTYNPIPKKTLQPPDQVFKIPHLNTNAMREHVRKVETGVACGDISYQLLPRVNAMDFLRELPGYIAQDPVDIHFMQKTATILNKKTDLHDESVYNCATLVEKLLAVGGVPSIHGARLWYPWDPTPNGVAQHLEDLSYQSSKSDADEDVKR